jgi:hypothetical protein
VATLSSVRPPAPRPVLLDAHDDRWRQFVQAHPDRLPAHGPEWLDTLAVAYGFRPFVLVVPALDGGVDAGIPLMDVRDPLTRGFAASRCAHR